MIADSAIPLPILSAARARRDLARVPPSAPPEVRAGRRMLDSHGRAIRDLRLSITDRCNFRCVYCMEPDVRFMDRDELLSVDEIARVARACVALGVTKIRITGGEPTVHPRLTDIIRSLAALDIPDLSMTTNGALVDDAHCAAWSEAGLSRLTISLDSLRPERFERLTRSRCTPARVVEAIRAAIRAGLEPVRVNAVVVRGFNDDEVVDLAALARDIGFEMRFIEFMPLDSARAWDRARVVPAAEVRDRIDAVLPLEPVARDNPHATALRFRFADGAPGGVGLVAPVTRAFCGACSRLRITADGKVRPCLFSRTEWDLRSLLRAGATDPDAERFLIDATWTKQAGHGISSAGFVQPERTMSAIGG